MPPYLATPYFHLSKLPVSTKIVLTSFSLSVCTAIIFVTFFYYPGRTNSEEESARNFVKNKDQALLGLKADFAKHQLIDNTEEMKSGMRRQDLEHAFDIIHPHSFLMPVLYFILCHLCEMSALIVWIKIVLYVSAFIAMMISIFAPLLIYSSVGFAVICHLSFYVMLASFFIMAIMPLFQMWKPVRANIRS